MAMLEDLGLGISAKLKFPADIRAAARELPVLDTEFARFNTALEDIKNSIKRSAPYLLLGGATIVAAIFITRSKGVYDASRRSKRR